MKNYWLLFFAFVGALSAQETEMPHIVSAQPYAPPAPPEPPSTPWLTGPLIAPIGAVVPYGDFEIQTYVYATTNVGTYNQDWDAQSSDHNFFSLNPQWQCFFGLTPWMDINIVPEFFYNVTAGKSSVNFGDLQVAFDFQFLDPAATPYFPGIKFIVRETFPTGSFQRLNPDKLLTDQSGAGTFATTFDVVLYKVYHLRGKSFLSTTYSAAYTITSPTRVHGFNTYGGGFGTNGTVMPGNTFQGIVSFEWALNQNWVLALDNVYLHIDKTQFCGVAGTSSTPAEIAAQLPPTGGGPAVGIPAVIGTNSSEQISFAPAIEYNFSANFGIIAGCWFSAWGRNSAQFRSGVINIDYTY